MFNQVYAAGMSNHNIDTVTIDVAGWDRYPEVAAYALTHNISISEAIRHFVNAGLSHS